MSLNMYKMTERMNFNAVKVTPVYSADGWDDVFTQHQKECDLMLSPDGVGRLCI